MKSSRYIICTTGVVIVCGTLSFCAFIFYASYEPIPHHIRAAGELHTYGNRAGVEKESYTVVTYNIGYLSGMFNNMPVKQTKRVFDDNLRDAHQLLSQIAPDIIAFQEIDLESQRSFDVNQSEALAESLQLFQGAIAINWSKRYLPFPYWPPTIHYGRILSAQAVLSRYPIRFQKPFRLARPKNNPFWYNAFYINRLAQVVILSLGTEALTLINVHFDAYDRATRERQAEELVAIAKPYTNGPLIVLGDFNTVPPDAQDVDYTIEIPEYKRWTESFRGERTLSHVLDSLGLKMAIQTPVSLEERLQTYTYPACQPAHKIDYILYNRFVEKKTAYTVVSQLKPSDHLPVVMTFALKRDSID